MRKTTVENALFQEDLYYHYLSENLLKNIKRWPEAFSADHLQGFRTRFGQGEHARPLPRREYDRLSDGLHHRNFFILVQLRVCGKCYA